MSPPAVLVVRSGARSFGSVPGADLIEYVSHTIEPVAAPSAQWNGGFDMVIVTSQTAVERITRDAGYADALRAVLDRANLVAVGEATAELLRLQGFQPDLVAGGSARSVFETLAGSVAGRKVLWPCGEEVSLDLASLLRERGAEVRKIVLYRKRAVPKGPGVSAEITVREPAAFCTTSPAAAEWLFDDLSAEAVRRLQATPAVALGSATLERLAAFGVETVRVAPEARFRSAAALLSRLATRPAGQ